MKDQAGQQEDGVAKTADAVVRGYAAPRLTALGSDERDADQNVSEQVAYAAPRLTALESDGVDLPENGSDLLELEPAPARETTPSVSSSSQEPTSRPERAQELELDPVQASLSPSAAHPETDQGQLAALHTPELFIQAWRRRLTGTLFLVSGTGGRAAFRFIEGVPHRWHSIDGHDLMLAALADQLPPEQLSLATHHAHRHGVDELGAILQLRLLSPSMLQRLHRDCLVRELERLAATAGDVHFQFSQGTDCFAGHPGLSHPVQPVLLISEALQHSPDLSWCRGALESTLADALSLQEPVLEQATMLQGALRQVVFALQRQPESFNDLLRRRALPEPLLVAVVYALHALGCVFGSRCRSYFGPAKALHSLEPAAPLSADPRSVSPRSVSPRSVSGPERVAAAPLPHQTPAQPAAVPSLWDVPLTAPPSATSAPHRRLSRTSSVPPLSDRPSHVTTRPRATKPRAPAFERTGPWAALSQREQQPIVAGAHSAGAHSAGAHSASAPRASAPPASAPPASALPASVPPPSVPPASAGSRSTRPASQLPRRSPSQAARAAATSRVHDERQVESQALEAWMQAVDNPSARKKMLRVGQQAAELFPTNPRILFYLGCLFSLNGNPLEAEAVLDRVLELDPDHIEAQREIDKLVRVRKTRSQSGYSFLSRIGVRRSG